VNTKNPDVYTEFEKRSHSQYFSFRAFVSGLRGANDVDGNGIKFVTVRYVIANAHASSFPEAWPGYTVCYSSNSLESNDDDSWRRNSTTKYVDGKLVWDHVHDMNGSIFFCYYPPYTYGRHLKLISDVSSRISTKGGSCDGYNPMIESLGLSLEGREIECISVGNGNSIAWIQHRQHPGETMAGEGRYFGSVCVFTFRMILTWMMKTWTGNPQMYMIYPSLSSEFFAEGFLHRLFGVGKDGELDEATVEVLTRYRLYIVPNMCPDGSVCGHLRTNSVGANLNREWSTVHDDYDAPTMHRSPEVYAVLSKMDRTGCDFFLDVHGDEDIPYVFFSGAEKTPTWGDRLEKMHGYFVSCYRRANPDVQKEIGYPPPDSPEDALKYMNVATNQLSTRFNCLGLTLEMPYKDCATNPDPVRGFGPDRTKRLGANLIEALVDVHPYLRAEGEFWDAFSEEDGYVIPTDNYKEQGFVMLKKRFYSDVRPHDDA
jgi:murein tripeptide amidase MpaA